MTAHFSQDSAWVSAELLELVKLQDSGTTEIFLEHMESSATVMPLGLMHIRPLQHWLHVRVLRWAWRCGAHHVTIMTICCNTFSLGWTLRFYDTASRSLHQGKEVTIVTKTFSMDKKMVSIYIRCL